MASNTKTLQNSINWTSPFVGFRQLAFGTNMEPALTSANLIIQLFLSPPFKWNWNRNSVNFLTIDPANLAWVASTVYALGQRMKDSNGNMQTVTTAGTSGAVVPGTQYTITSVNNAGGGNTVYNGTFTATSLAGLTVTIAGFVTHAVNNGTFVIQSNTASTLTVNNAAGVAETHAATATIETPWSTVNGGSTTDGTVVWQMSPITDYFQNISDFGFIEQAFVVDAAGNVNEIPNLTTELTFDNGTGRATSIAPVLDNNAGGITFRFMPGIPDQKYTVYVIYQKRAALLSALTGTNGTWPIPDFLAPIYNWGFMALMMLFCGDSRFPQINAKFIGSLLAISEGLDEQQKNIFLDQWMTIRDMHSRKEAKGTQGFEGRGQ